MARWRPSRTRRNTLHQNAPSCHQEAAVCDTLSGRWLRPGYVRCDTADTSLVSAACSAASASSRALICKPFACRASLPAQLAQRAVNGYTYVLPAAARKLRAAKPKNGRAKRNLSICRARRLEACSGGSGVHAPEAPGPGRTSAAESAPGSPFDRRGDLASLFGCLVAPLGGVDSPGGA